MPWVRLSQDQSEGVEVSAKVLEAVAFGNIVLPTEKRHHMVNVWITFARTTKSLIVHVGRILCRQNVW